MGQFYSLCPACVCMHYPTSTCNVPNYCAYIRVCICGYYSRAGFILFSESERIDAGTIQGRKVLSQGDIGI